MAAMPEAQVVVAEATKVGTVLDLPALGELTQTSVFAVTVMGTDSFDELPQRSDASTTVS
jgi:hypothetical protein